MREDEGTSQDNVQKAHNLQRGSAPRGSGTEGLKQVENPYYPAFDILLAQFLAHEEVLKIVTRMIPSDGEGAPELAARGISADLMSDQFDGLVADICEMRQDGFVRCFPTLRFPQAGKEARSHVNQTFRRRCCGWIVAEAYESFREFIEMVNRELSAKITPKRHGSLARILKKRMRKRTRRSPKDLLKRIRRTAAELRSCENRNSRGINLSSWFAVLTSVRDSVAHNNAIIKPWRLRKLDVALLKAHFPGERDAETGYVLNLTPEVTRDTITRLREYALAIYKAASSVSGLTTTIYDSRKGMTRWKR